MSRLGGNRGGALSRFGGINRSGSSRLGDRRRRRRSSLSSGTSGRLDLTSGRTGRSSSDLGGRAGRGSGSISGDAELLLNQVGVVGEAVSGLGSSAVDVRSSGTVGRGSSSGSRVTIETGAVLAGKCEKLVALGALGNLDAVLVGPLLDLRVGPRVKKSVAQALLGGGSRRGGLGIDALGALTCKARLAAEASNERVASRGLGNVVAALVEPSLEVRVGPGSVEPVTRVVGSLRGLVGNRLVVLADSLQKGVTLARLRNRNAVLVGESLELRIRPAAKRQYMISIQCAVCSLTCQRSSP